MMELEDSRKLYLVDICEPPDLCQDWVWKARFDHLLLCCASCDLPLVRTQGLKDVAGELGQPRPLLDLCRPPPVGQTQVDPDNVLSTVTQHSSQSLSVSSRIVGFFLKL